jgi:hypothetical protein
MGAEIKNKNLTPKTFGTLAGVFTPTTLAILGVILHIRQPWEIGKDGIIGAILIILRVAATALFCYDSGFESALV